MNHRSITNFLRRHGKVASVATYCGLAAACVLGVTQARSDENVPTPELHRLGNNVYQESCAICHGPNGDGTGSLASEFQPGPRNFTLGNFKFGSTSIGEPPARADLVKVIENGIEGATGRSMPAFTDFSQSELLGLVEVVRQFAGFETYGSPLSIPNSTKPYVKSDALDLYKSAGCVECHGANFDGKGPAAAGLRDQNDSPIAAADFTAQKFKGGSDPSQVWLRIYRGIPGTPMPSFGQTLSADDIWALTDLVVSAR